MKNEGGEPEDLRSRTKRFALAIIRLSIELPRSEEVSIIRRQMLKSGTSVGAHYREGCRARSDAEFQSKLQGGLAELEETMYWLELLMESKLYNRPVVHELHQEADELTRIFVAIIRKSKGL